MPDPATFPREAWKAEVEQGYRFIATSFAMDPNSPPEAAARAYFEERAPEHLPAPAFEVAETGSTLFRRAESDELESEASAAVSNVRYFPRLKELWACDMSTGALVSAKLGARVTEVVKPSGLFNPCRITAVDWHSNGQAELLISSLGSFYPEDHQLGAVWSVDPHSDWQVRPILSPAARVSDVQAGDFDQDGDLDLAVAEFGWRRTGRVLLLWNDGPSTWRTVVLDGRHGSIDVPIADVNGDGLLDVVALISQEHETVTAYLNEGKGQFRRVDLYGAENPSFGSTGIELVDFDRDDDIDVLYTNGDSFDSAYLKPYHGVRWLENQGHYPFVVHELAQMAGAHRAAAGDLDLDGDVDVVAVSLLPRQVRNPRSGLASILWIEQRPGQQFQRHVVEVDHADHACCELVDWNSDGDLDLIVTHFRWDGEKGRGLTLFHNRTR